MQWDRWQIVAPHEISYGDFLIVEPAEEKQKRWRYESFLGICVHENHFVHILSNRDLAVIKNKGERWIITCPGNVWLVATLRNMSDVKVVRAFKPWIEKT